MKMKALFIIVAIIILLLVAALLYGAKRHTNTNETTAEWLYNTPLAHRGLYTTEIDENSLSAFQNAIDNGYAIECDLHSTKDGVVVVIHDNALKRLTGKSGRVSALTYDELQKYTLLKSNETIPTLEEVLELVNGQVPLLIEIKDFNLQNRFENEIIPILSGYKGEFAIQSFNPFSCRYVKLERQDWCVGLLITGQKTLSDTFLGRCKDNILTSVYTPDFIVYNYSCVTSGMLDVYRANGTAVLGYVLSESDINSNSYSDRVDNIIFELDQNNS